jgi:outer membrane receptor protein involved in Fe transport
VAKNYHLGSHTSTFETGFYIRNAHKFDDSYEIDFTPNDVTAIPATMFLTNFHNSSYYGGNYKFGPGISWEAVNAYYAANPNQFTVSTQIPNSNNYDLVERVTAGYIMNSLDFSRFRLVAGVRFEGTEDRTLSFDNTAGTLSFPGQGSYISVLPSASLRMRLDSQNNSAVRFVYARGLSRPDPSFLTTAPSLDNSTTPATVTIGNPALRPQHGDNFDIVYERYLTPLGSIQAGFFYKRLTDPIVSLLSGPRLSILNVLCEPGCELRQRSHCGGRVSLPTTSHLSPRFIGRTGHLGQLQLCHFTGEECEPGYSHRQSRPATPGSQHL